MLMSGRMTDQWFRAIVESAPDSILVVDNAGKITFANERVEALFGYRPDELIGSEVEILLADGLRERHRGLSQQYMLHPQVRPMGKAQNLSGRHKEGHSVPVEICLSPNHSGDESFIVAIVRDVSARRRMEQLMKESEQNFRTIFEMSPAGVAMVSPERKLTRVNKAFLSLFGFEREGQVLGHEVWEMVVPEDRPRLFDAFRELSAHPRKEGTELRIKGTEGNELWVRLSLTLIHDGRIGPAECCCIFVDISAQKAVERSLTDRAEDLLKSNQKLEEFASVASHDLRAPARRAATLLKMFYKEYGAKIGGPGKETLDYAVTEVNKMQAVVDDLLVYSSVCAVRPELRPISLIKVLGDTLEILRTDIEEKRAKITYGFLPKVAGNELQLRRLFSNLISNAIKFNKGRPVIHISAIEYGDSHVISVKDNGVGLPETELVKIFDIFHRAHSEADFPGTGIGLASCKRIMENHGGLISAMSQGQEGSTFILTFLHQTEITKTEHSPGQKSASIWA